MWCLLVFFHWLVDYRSPDVEFLAELFGAFGTTGEEKVTPPPRLPEWRLPENHYGDLSFHFVSLPFREVARNIADRSMLVGGIYELWGQGNSYEEFEKAIRNFPDERKLPYLTSESTY